MRLRDQVKFFSIGLLAVWSLVVQPALADRPPDGYAQPPIHFRPDATSGPRGVTPAQIKKFYGIDQVANQGAGQTIAIIDAFDDPNIESDLGVFSSQFGLPACTTANGCFKKIYAQGSLPRTDAGWALEISLDVEWAHAVAPAAKILLVEANTNSFSDLMGAVDVAVAQGASVASMSFGGNEFSGELSYDYHFTSGAAINTTFTASSGDSGNGVEFPAASPSVVAVGGTTITLGDSTGSYGSEKAWSGSGGGISSQVSEPLYQSAFPVSSGGKRGVPDVAYNGDPNSGFPVYDTVRLQGRTGWFQVGGTSAGSPQVAALVAIANSIRAGLGKGPIGQAQSALYNAGSYATMYHDVTTGTNGSCGAVCTASTGYDFVTGLGTPKAAAWINAIVNY